MSEEGKRLTVEGAKQVMEKWGFALIHLHYGMRNNKRAGCAVSLAVLAHVDDPQKTADIIEEARNNYSHNWDTNNWDQGMPVRILSLIAPHTGMSPDYLRGLELGYEWNPNTPNPPLASEEMSLGILDGRSLRPLTSNIVPG